MYTHAHDFVSRGLLLKSQFFFIRASMQLQSKGIIDGAKLCFLDLKNEQIAVISKDHPQGYERI